MKAIGISYVHDWKRLHYPIGLTLRSLEPLDEIVLVTGENDETPREMPNGDRGVVERIPWPIEGGAVAYRKILHAALTTAIDRGATHVLVLEADECMHAADVNALVKSALPAAWLTRLQLWRDPYTLRLDWSHALARWSDVSSLGQAEWREGDASSLPVKRSFAVQHNPEWPIWHLSRIGSPRMIMERRRAVCAPWGPGEFPDEYDFVPRRYEDWTPGKMPPEVEALTATLTFNRPPDGVVDWMSDDEELGR